MFDHFCLSHFESLCDEKMQHKQKPYRAHLIQYVGKKLVEMAVQWPVQANGSSLKRYNTLAETKLSKQTRALIQEIDQHLFYCA